jgi:CHASE2 domain-containing sensor protein
MSNPRHDPPAADSVVPADEPERPRPLGQPTQALAGVIVAGVIVQSALAGGFLAGRPALRDVHEHLGYGLLAAGLALLVIGLLGRRSESAITVRLPTRIALVLALAVTVFVGMRASRGTSDLLMLHIPLAFGILALATRLLVQGSSDRRTPAEDRASDR